jgi:hypothetical protein
MASRLVQEKQAAAAARQGSQRAARCSSGARRTGVGVRDAQAEDVLGVVRHAGGIADAPFGKYLVAVGLLPVDQARCCRLDAGFFSRLPGRRCREQASPVFLAAGDRLPEARVAGAFQQQDVQRRRVDHHQHRDRLLVVTPF